MLFFLVTLIEIFMMYLVKTPWIVKKIFPDFIWNIDTNEKTIYLTFDDGPHPTITPFVLKTLKDFDAKASFFCIGKNVKTHTEIYQSILKAGHQVGNHTQQHLKGRNTPLSIYIEDVMVAQNFIQSKLFRPPYGSIKRNQSKELMSKGFKIVMWDVLSADFDLTIDKEKCLNNVISKTKSGSIVVFHDSEKAFNKLEYCLPKVLEHFSQLGFTFKALPEFK